MSHESVWLMALAREEHYNATESSVSFISVIWQILDFCMVMSSWQSGISLKIQKSLVLSSYCSEFLFLLSFWDILTFLTLSQYNEAEWDFVCCGHSFEKFSFAASSFPDRHSYSVLPTISTVKSEFQSKMPIARSLDAQIYNNSKHIHIFSNITNVFRVES